MKTRIIRAFSPSKCHDVYCVQLWLTKEAAQNSLRQVRPGLDRSTVVLESPVDKALWEPVKDFELDEYDKACAFAMDLSMSKKSVTEVATFEDGALIQTAGHAPSCYVYRNAGALLGADRRGMCTCGFEQRLEQGSSPTGCDPGSADHSYNPVKIAQSPPEA